MPGNDGSCKGYLQPETASLSGRRHREVAEGPAAAVPMTRLRLEPGTVFSRLPSPGRGEEGRGREGRKQEWGDRMGQQRNQPLLESCPSTGARGHQKHHPGLLLPHHPAARTRDFGVWAGGRTRGFCLSAGMDGRGGVQQVLASCRVSPQQQHALSRDGFGCGACCCFPDNKSIWSAVPVGPLRAIAALAISALVIVARSQELSFCMT